MTKEQASIVINLMLKHGAELDSMLMYLQQSGFEGTELAKLCKQVGHLMAAEYDIMHPIFAAYPELKPRELD